MAEHQFLFCFSSIIYTPHTTVLVRFLHFTLVHCSEVYADSCLYRILKKEMVLLQSWLEGSCCFLCVFQREIQRPQISGS